MLDELLELSYYRKDNLVTPLVIEYFTLERLGFESNYILCSMKEKYMRN